MPLGCAGVDNGCNGGFRAGVPCISHGWACCVCNRTNQEAERGTMKAATIVGILLIVLGIIGFAMGGISFTHEKKDVDLGPLQVQHKQTKTLPISPILSTIAVLGGIGLVVVGARGRQ